MEEEQIVVVVVVLVEVILWRDQSKQVREGLVASSQVDLFGGIRIQRKCVNMMFEGFANGARLYREYLPLPLPCNDERVCEGPTTDPELTNELAVDVPAADPVHLLMLPRFSLACLCHGSVRSIGEEKSRLKFWNTGLC